MNRALALATLALTACGACGNDEGTALTVEQLQDPEACMSCHPKHTEQWMASMHAYASEDPVFVAMNRRGQRETHNGLGTFCVKCHAPMAVELGLTQGFDFDPAALPARAKGVTCYFCHNVKSVAADHNNGLVLANDRTMRGGVKDPVAIGAHGAAYDKQMDAKLNQSEICGACHDVTTPAPHDVPIERTFEEWKTTFFSQADPAHHLTCGSCHMSSTTGLIADVPGTPVKSRTNGFHEHLWPGIDQALTPFPGLDAMAAGIKRDLDGAIGVIGPAPLTSPVQPGGICLDPPGVISVRMDSIGTAHNWPSGSAQDRRAWLEVQAFDAANNVVFQSGVVGDRQDPDDVLATDPTLVGLWDRTFKDDGTPAHFFWEVAKVQPVTLKPPVTLDKNSPAFDHSMTARLTVGPSFTQIDHITARVRIRPLSYALLNDLVASGDLAADIPAQMKTLDIKGTMATWSKATKGTGPATNTNCAPH
ncbi:MAG TPA: multiheme c-type cytochrome [Kofleriaceae bacterium]|nr:multiheme c-type cytochrome [Kofleriaceae bacterium]